MWQTIFAATNVVAVAGWIVLLALPRRPLPLALVLYGAVALLCLAYLVMFAGLFGGWMDPVRGPGASPQGPSDYSVAGIMEFFRSEGGVVLGWTHYLAFDLFVGLWIARDADAKAFSRMVQVPFLLATYVAGPIGLIAWLVVRERRARGDGGWSRNGKTPAG